MAFIIFYSIVITLYTLINYYIFSRGLNALPDGGFLKAIFPWVFWGMAATYVAGRILERIYLSFASDILVWTGSFWLAGMLYFFLAVAIIDLIRVFNYLIPFYPDIIVRNYTTIKQVLFFGVLAGVSIVVTAGHINTRYPVVRTIHIPIEKKANGAEKLNAVMLSDIHLGTLIGNGHFEKIVNKVQSLHPDIILLAGDMLDEDLEPVLRQNIGQTLKQLNAPLGVYAVMGNHEYIGGAEAAYQYLKGYGITMLRDSVIKIEESFFIIGREDRDKPRFSGNKRRALSELVSETNPDYPIILIDHQPYYLEEASELGVDLQLSGHTHHGQLWPLNYITSSIFTISRGYGKVGDMHVYVSNGVGTWGPPVRIGSRPEIIQLNIAFGKEMSPKDD